MRTLEQQIRSTDFALSRKGYDPSSVDAALEGFADDVAALLATLRKESIRVSTLERSLTFAQNSGTTSAPDLAALMVEANETKERLLADARQRAAEIVAEAAERATGPTIDLESGSNSGESSLRETQIQLALEEAGAIEEAARELAEAIRVQAEADAARVLDSARAAARRLDPVDTGTGASGVELAQQYG